METLMQRTQHTPSSQRQEKFLLKSSRQHTVRRSSFPCAVKGEVKWPIPLHLECYLQRELHLDHGKLTILLITATFLCTIRVSKLGSLQSNSCSQLQFSQYVPFAATVLQNERGRRKGEQEIAALAEMINGKHFAFCLAIRAMQVELLQVLPKIP